MPDMFEPVDFVQGLNVVMAEIRLPENRNKDTHNLGKTTLGRICLRLIEPSDGRVIFAGQDITELGANEMYKIRREMQIVFQNPYSSLSPRFKIADVVAEPLLAEV